MKNTLKEKDVFVCENCLLAEIEDDNGRDSTFLHCYGLNKECNCMKCLTLKDAFNEFVKDNLWVKNP